MRIPSQKKQKRSLRIIIFIVIILALLIIAGLSYWVHSVLLTNSFSDEIKFTDTSTTSTDGHSTSSSNNTNGGNIDNKTPEQYSGQTEDVINANSIEFDNEQFRIPEDEL